MTSLAPLDERADLVVWIARLNPALSPNAAYGYDDVPGMRGTSGQTNAGTVPPIYVAVSLSRRVIQNRRITGQRGYNGVRLTTLVVGRTEAEARWARAKVAGAVEEAMVTFAAGTSTPVEFENETDITYDDGAYSGLTAWVYVV